MNIVILQGAFFPVPPLLGGAVEKMWFKLGQEFAKLGHHVTHISKQYPGFPDEEMIDGVQHRRVTGHTPPKSMLKQKFLDAVYSWRAVKSIPTSTDIVITNSFWSPIFLLVNKHAVVYVDVARMPKGQLKFYSRADCFRANSGAVVAAIKDEIPATEYHRIRMVPNPLPFNALSEINFEIKESIILYCGRVHEEKGLELLARAVNRIDLKGWRIKIVGPWNVSMGGSGEDYKNNLVKCFEKCNVEFTGPIFDESKLNEIYSKATIFVYPSLAEKGETFGLAPLEAMAWGNVPIVSNLTCFKDFIQHDANGLIFDHRSTTPDVNLAESIERLIESASLRENLAIQALKVRETHSTVKIANQFIVDFELLINSRRARLAQENKFKDV